MKRALSILIILLAIPIMLFINSGVLMVFLPAINWLIKGNLLLVFTGGFIGALTVALILGFIASMICVIMGKLTEYKVLFSVIVALVVLVDLGIRVYSTWSIMNFENIRTWVSLVYVIIGELLVAVLCAGSVHYDKNESKN